MILTAQQALEVGEALLDAANDASRYGKDHAVVTICGGDVAIAMNLDEYMTELGYEPIITVKSA